jgi:hypothetical protein
MLDNCNVVFRTENGDRSRLTNLLLLVKILESERLRDVLLTRPRLAETNDQITGREISGK